jgi:hypothetical protein
MPVFLFNPNVNNELHKLRLCVFFGGGGRGGRNWTCVSVLTAAGNVVK